MAFIARKIAICNNKDYPSFHEFFIMLHVILNRVATGVANFGD